MLQWWATNLGWIKLMVCNMNTILENNHYCITITPGLCCKNSLKGQSCCQPYCSVVRTSLGKQRCITQHFMKSHRQQSKAHRDWWGRRFSSEILGGDFSNVKRKKTDQTYDAIWKFLAVLGGVVLIQCEPVASQHPGHTLCVMLTAFLKSWPDSMLAHSVEFNVSCIASLHSGGWGGVL